jgi:3-oxoacyl-[acyl-carrier protein] reductase
MTAPPTGPVDLDDQTAVVTGAAGDIGQATCESLAREGADIVAIDVDTEGLATVKALVEDQSSDCTVIECDVTDVSDVDRLREITLDTYHQVDILVTAHGTVSRVTLSEMSFDDWQRILDVNLTGTALITQAFYDGMKANGYGKIVCVGSIAGKVGGVISGPNYVASKGGVHAFVKWMATNAAEHGVYANAIAPGPVRTAMTRNENYTPDMSPLNRLGEPEDIAEGIVFLASQQSNWITGLVLDVNGGMLMD